jgi:hypothetical protein
MRSARSPASGARARRAPTRVLIAACGRAQRPSTLLDEVHIQLLRTLQCFPPMSLAEESEGDVVHRDDEGNYFVSRDLETLVMESSWRYLDPLSWPDFLCRSPRRPPPTALPPRPAPPRPTRDARAPRRGRRRYLAVRGHARHGGVDVVAILREKECARPPHPPAPAPLLFVRSAARAQLPLNSARVA